MRSPTVNFRKFRKDGRGVAAIEFALILPILALLMLGCFEVPSLVLLYQKLARTSAGVADLVAQADDPMTANQLNDIFTAAQSMMSPYDLNANGAVIVSSINTITTAAGPKITWQRRYGSLSAADAPGKLGAASATPSAALPIDLRPALNEEVLTVEVYFTFTPIFRSYIYNGSTLYLVAYTRPRNHNLTTPPPAS